jgi:hypothetical protein
MKIIRTAFVLFALAIVAAVPLAAAVPKHQFKQLKLEYTTTDPDIAGNTPVWQHVPGNEISDFKLKLDPSVPYFYLDIMELKPYTPLVTSPAQKDTFPFYVDTTALPAGYWDYWINVRGADPNGNDVQKLLYAIVSGAAPIFYLKVYWTPTTTNYRLIDGFLYQYTLEYYTLRVDGSYLLGTYTYYGTIHADTYVLQMTFK